MKKLFLSFIVLAMALTATAARPYFVGHRGSYWGVENTKQAFEQGCIRGQFDYLETDIKVTKDNVFICTHDDNTSRLGASNKTIASTKWDVLKDIEHTQKRGSKTYTGYLCTLDEYLDICKKYGKRPVIELKWATGINSNDCSKIPDLVKAIEAKGFRKTCIILTSMKPCLEYIHDKYPDMTLQFLTGQYWESHFTWCKSNGIDVDIQSGSWLTKSTVTKYHNAGLKVNMWTVNSTSAYNTHKNMGCDFITTDYLEPSDFGLTQWEAKDWPGGGSIGGGEDNGNTGGTTDPTKSLTVDPTTDIVLSGTIGQTEAAPSVTLTVKGENLTTNISANASTGAVIVTKESGWNDLTGGKLKVTLDTDFEKGAGEYSGYVAIQSTSSYRTTINVKATLKAGEGTTPPVENPDDEQEEPAQPATPQAGTHTMSEALWAKAGSTYSFGDKANRSISYYNNELYIPQSDKGSFVVVDPATGNVKQTYTIGTPSFLQHNLRITSDGQMMLGNTNTEASEKAQVYVCTSSLQGSEEMSPMGTVLVGARSDYFHIHGSWEKGGNLLVLANDSNKVIQIPFTGGSLAPEIEIHHTDIPTGTSAVAIPSADGKSFYASVSGSIPTQHDMASGQKIDAFTGTAKPTAVNASGLGVFQLHGHTYMVTPASATSGKFDLFDITDGLSKAQLLYTKDPQLGETKNNAMTIDFCTHISGNDAFIYVIVPNNGVAAYKFTFTPEGGTTPDQGETTEPSTPSGPLEGSISIKADWKKTLADLGLSAAQSRTMAIHNGTLYLANGSTGYFTINRSTGTVASTDTVSGIANFHGHNLCVTADGQLIVGNSGSGGSAITAYTISTGTATALTPTATISKRTDYFKVYGSWNTSGYILALEQGTGRLVKMPFSNGKLSDAVAVENTSLAAGNIDKAYPIDENSFYASRAGKLIAKHSLSTGDIIEEFGDVKPATPNTSGLAVFTIHGHTYMITPTDRNGAFEIFEITEGISKATNTNLGGSAIGIGANGTGVEFCTHIEGNNVEIFVLDPYSGLAKHTFTFTPKGGVTTSVEDIVSAARILPTYSGVEIFFEGTQSVAVYNVNGMQVAGGVATEHFACDLQSGMYIIRVGNEAYKFVK